MVGGLGTSLGHGEVWIGVPVRCYMEYNTMQENGDLTNQQTQKHDAVCMLGWDMIPVFSSTGSEVLCQ